MWLIRSGRLGQPARARSRRRRIYEAAGHEFWANTEKAVYFYRPARRAGVLFQISGGAETRNHAVLELDNEHGTITQDDRYILCDSSAARANCIGQP
jgi:hypothetical protein